jgi:uncharacterized membrane protein YgcG
MAIRTFKEIIDNKGYRINSKDREIFEQGNLQSFFGLGDTDAIEFIIYDTNDNQLPQGNTGELVRYVPLSTQNIKDYILLPEGTVLQRYKFPKEYFVDAERLLREAGYQTGIFKTQITLLNKRVGSDSRYDKLWISEISPSRTEVRLFPLKKGLNTNPELKKRFELMLRDGNFRDDTIYFVFQFIESIKPQQISSFIKSKYSEKFLNRLKQEFKIQDFETFCTKIHEKFVEASTYEFTNRISNIRDVNYGKTINRKPSIELTKNDIVERCRRLMIQAIDYNLSVPNVTTKTTFDAGNDASFDEVGKVLQRRNSDTRVDTGSPVVNLVRQRSLQTTQLDIVIAKEKEKTASKPPAKTKDGTAPPPPPPPPAPPTEDVSLYSYLIENTNQDKNVVVRWQDAFKDGKQQKVGPGDAIDICALEGSINVIQEDREFAEFVRIKKVGRCDKTNTNVTSPSRRGNTDTGGGSGGGSGTRRNGSDDGGSGGVGGSGFDTSSGDFNSITNFR